MSEMLLQTKDKFQDLDNRLSACQLVRQYGPEEPGTLVHAFSDLEGSMRVFLDEQLPKLVDPSVTGEMLEDLLLDISGEFQHILYHLHDPKLFRVNEPTHDWLTVQVPIK